MNGKGLILTLLMLPTFLLTSSICRAQNKINELKDSGFNQLHQNRFKAAIESYSLCLKLKKESDVYYSRSLAYMGLSKVDSALADLQSALKIDSNHYKSILAKANILKNQNHFKEASILFDKALKLKPGETEPWLAKAQLQLALKDSINALKSLDAYIKNNTSNPEAYHLRGIILIGQKQQADAAFNFNRALFLNPKYLPSLLQRAELYYQRDYLAITFADLETAFTIDSNLTEVHELYSKVYFKLGEYKLAKKHINLTSRYTKPSLEIELIKAEIALNDGHPDQCLSVVNQIVGQYPLLNKAYLLRAKANFAKGKAEICFKDCEKIILSGDSTLPEAFKYRALSRTKEKDHSEWKKNLSDIYIYLKFKPLDPQAWYLKAHYNYLLNENDYCEDYQKAKQLGLQTLDNELEIVCK
ncbi:MAG TPA: tetratricopeptide repeat protein [Bacteroidia bacterium]